MQAVWTTLGIPPLSRYTDTEKRHILMNILMNRKPISCENHCQEISIYFSTCQERKNYFHSTKRSTTLRVGLYTLVSFPIHYPCSLSAPLGNTDRILYNWQPKRERESIRRKFQITILDSDADSMCPVELNGRDLAKCSLNSRLAFRSPSIQPNPLTYI